LLFIVIIILIFIFIRAIGDAWVPIANPRTTEDEDEDEEPATSRPAFRFTCAPPSAILPR
jgi:hypothetical protein